MENISQPFFVKNCSLSTLATGDRANTLIELRDKLTTINEGCIYHHFWGGRLKPQFIHSQHHNDFASWVFNSLHDPILAERLSIIDPTEFDSLEGLRLELVEVIDKRLDEEDSVCWIKREERFHFIHSMLIVFESDKVISHPEDLSKTIAQFSPGSIFYHFIDARTRTVEKMDDFSIWLETFGGRFKELISDIQSIDPFFLSLTQLKEELTLAIQKHIPLGETNG